MALFLSFRKHSAGGASAAWWSSAMVSHCVPSATRGRMSSMSRRQPYGSISSGSTSLYFVNQQQEQQQPQPQDRRYFSKMAHTKKRQERDFKKNSARKSNNRENDNYDEKKAKEYEAFVQWKNKSDGDDDKDYEQREEEFIDHKMNRSKPSSRAKLPTPLKQQELRRLAGPDPYDNPTARKIQQWSMVENQIMTAERETLQWVRRVVVGLNLCPFAEQIVSNEDLFKVRIVLDSDMTEADTIVEIVVQELNNLVNRNKGTTLVVCPNLYRQNFSGFLQILDVVEQNLQEQGWEGVVQVAPFHPRFVFAGDSSQDLDAPDHCTNRSPHPTFHLLREADVSRAVERLPNQGDASTVWQRNVQLLQQLHATLPPEEFTAVVTGQQERSATLQQTVRSMVQQHRIALVHAKKNVHDESESSTSSSSDSDDDDDSVSSSDDENDNVSSSDDEEENGRNTEPGGPTNITKNGDKDNRASNDNTGGK